MIIEISENKMNEITKIKELLSNRKDNEWRNLRTIERNSLKEYLKSLENNK